MRPIGEPARQRGTLGEGRAVDFLRGSGYEVLARNFRTRRGEIDVVARDADTLVFVEVKSWKTIDIGELEFSISKRKQRRIIDASKYYLMQEGLGDRTNVRYDVIFVRGDSMEVQHVRDAFTETT